MVDISPKIEKIFSMVEDGFYFTINRGRQYGKTTTINRLRKRLSDDYICASISFQYPTPEMFASDEGFCQELLALIHNALLLVDEEEANQWIDENIKNFRQLSALITKRCKGKKIVLIIDESDEASNNNIFVRFLKMLRDKYLMRAAGDDYTFQSVILAGVYDVRNLKQKMILQGNYTPTSGESPMNSPWNIAVDFDIDMSFSAKEIETMLVEYENDYNTGMNISEIAQEIRFYTNGYPYLVSRICLLIETKLDRNWTLKGVQEAIKMILDEKSTLFDDLTKKVQENQELSELLFDLTVGKIKYPYNADDPIMNIGLMFGFLEKGSEGLQIQNRIFEIRITDYFIAYKLRKWRENNIAQSPVNEIIKDNVFDMELCLTKFQKHYAEIYTEKDLKFLERDGKLIFLTYLKPLINGNGFYHFESETRDFGKIDLVVDFLKQQFIIELKLWYGNSKHESAYEQLANYLKSKNTDCGYLITFDFRKKRPEGFEECKWIEWDGKRIFDVILRLGEDDV
jgi:nitrogenase molybdenum-iron protein alpha/beta subunit